MRYSFAIFAAVAAAAPQVQPISQISDGQIQAPPATVIPGVTPGVTTTVVATPTAAPVNTQSRISAVVPPVCKFNHIDMYANARY
jgi:hypothetical protein